MIRNSSVADRSSNKRKLLLAGTVCWLMLLNNCAPAQSPSEKPIFGNSGFEIPEADQPVLEKAALAGDPDAAFRLATHYSVNNPMSAEGRYWTTIAAENGSPSGEYNLGFDLTLENDPGSQQRAVFWLKKAEKDGVKLATSLLQEKHNKEILRRCMDSGLCKPQQ